MDLVRVQQALQREHIDGWLLYDFRRSNELACRFLRLGTDALLTRRFFYWIPQSGKPVKIVHAIEPHHLDHLPGETTVYRSWQQLEARVAGVLAGAQVVAMEYSARNALPYVSKVDAGTVEIVRDCDVEVVSSADLLQQFVGVWDDEKLRLHREAATVVDDVVEQAWRWITAELSAGGNPTDYGVQQFIVELFRKSGCITNGMPICGINADSADPHYVAKADQRKPIRKGDFVLIDLWCKKNVPRATYADICRVAVVDNKPTPKQEEVFDIVRNARDAATTLVRNSFATGRMLMGCEIDQAARDVIERAGYGEFFTHRTGHNIDEEDHGDGTHIDNFETHDTRLIQRGTCFSIEPGIYLPNQFGIRLEYDIVVLRDGSVEVTGGIQESIRCLLP